MKRSLVAVALSVPLVLTGCSEASNDDAGTTSEGNTDNQIQQPPLPEGVTGVPTPGDDAEGGGTAEPSPATS